MGEIGAFLAATQAQHRVLAGRHQRPQASEFMHLLRGSFRIKNKPLLISQADVAAAATTDEVLGAFLGRDWHIFEAVDMERGGPGARNVLADMLRRHQLAGDVRAGSRFHMLGKLAVVLPGDSAFFRPLRVQQVLELDLQAVAFVHSQDQGARTFVGTQTHLAGLERGTPSVDTTSLRSA